MDGCLIRFNSKDYVMEVDELHHRYFIGEGDFYHIQASYHFILVSKGSCVMLIKGMPPLNVPENSLIFINPLVPHTFIGDQETGVEHTCLIWKFRESDGSNMLFHLQKLIVKECMEEEMNDFVVKQLSSFEANNFLQKQRRAEIAWHSNNRFISSMEAFNLLFYGIELLFSNMIDAADTIDPGKRIIVRIKQLVERRLANAQLGVSHIARSVGLNPSYLNTIFKASTGMPISNYIIQRRIALAKLLLENSNYNISEIADMCGFNQLSYFSRTFKKACAMSPNQYRSQPKKAVTTETDTSDF